MNLSLPTRLGARAVLAIALLTTGCLFGPPARVPLPAKTWSLGESPSTDLLVLLPGRGDDMLEYQRRGLVDYLLNEGRAGNLPFDVLVVDAHWGYYRARSLPERLGVDVIDPALAAGYERIHLFGISLGGFGSLVYWREHFDNVTSLTLLAPFLGEGTAQGSETDVLSWLLELPQERLDRIWLGWGEQDDFAVGCRQLAAVLDPSHVLGIQGGHDWETWRQLWPALIPSAASAPTPERSPAP